MLETADERRVNGPAPQLRTGKAAPGGLWPQLARLAAGAANVDELMELFIAWTHQTVGTAEVVNGSERFYLDNGKVFHDDSFYHARTSYFFDHFIFERRLSGQANPGRRAEGSTPFQLLLGELAQHQPAVALPLHERLQQLGGFRHSLFQIQKIAEKTLVLSDLVVPAKILVEAKPQETFRGLEKQTILQAFVFPLGQVNQLSSGIVLHPHKANRLIKRFVKQLRSSGEFNAKAPLSRLATVQLRYLRHRHVHPKLIYQALKD